MLHKEKARVKIDKQLNAAGWGIVACDEYVPMDTVAVKEALMQGNKESDYLLFIDNKAIAEVEAKHEENPLGVEVECQAEGYAIIRRVGMDSDVKKSSRLYIWQTGTRFFQGSS